VRARFPERDVVATPELRVLDAYRATAGAPHGAPRAFVGADARLAPSARERLIAAAMACYESLPWRWIEPAQLVHARPARAGAPETDAWWVSFGGEARSVPSVTLSRNRADLEAELDGRVPEALTPVASITYLVDGADVATLLTVRGCPGGALDAEEVAGLATVLRGSARFVARHQATFRGEPGTTFPVADSRDLAGLRLLSRGYADLEDAAPLKSGSVSWRSPPDWQPWLAAFDSWMADRALSLEERSWHCADAECLAEYAQAEGISPVDLHEAHIRRFLYDRVARQHAFTPDDALAAASSLALLFEMAAATLGLRAIWAHPLLADSAALLRRCRQYPGEAGAASLRIWERELDDQLARRVLSPPPAARVGRSDWLRWREELIASGATNPSSVRAALTRHARANISTLEL
jgi:hypothetical protein